MNYEIRIGIEAHLQLRTQTKMFCRCPIRFGAPPNSRVCPVCLGLPGALPVPNREAILMALALGWALDSELARRTRFDRKNYFYPDLPKGFQITQYAEPVAVGGALEIVTRDGVRRIRMRRVQLEEDSGKNLHDGPDRSSRIDFNRAGTPLVEIVSEPDLTSPAEARAYLQALRTLVRYLDISDGNMDQGNLRCEPNVNLCIEEGDEVTVTPITEIKNLNSVRNAERALEREIARQIESYRERGPALATEPRRTCGYDDETDRVFVMRPKESESDYRYFPEPDIPPIVIGAAWRDEAEARVPELAHQRRKRFTRDYALGDQDADQLCRSRRTADLYEGVLNAGASPKPAANWFLGELSRHAKERGCAIWELGLSASRIAGLVRLVESGGVGRGPAERELLPRMLEEGEEAGILLEELGLQPIEDPGQLEAAARSALEADPGAAADYRAGRGKAFDALMGALMKKTGGKANPRLAEDVLRRILTEET